LRDIVAPLLRSGVIAAWCFIFAIVYVAQRVDDVSLPAD
jgi:hypothetical protein